jgi:hypothetical protein
VSATVTWSAKRDSYVTRNIYACRSLWPRGLRRESAAVRLLGLRVRIPLGAWMSATCECCVLSGKRFCDGLITRAGDPYWVWCVWVWLRSLDSEEALAHWGCCVIGKKRIDAWVVALPATSCLRTVQPTKLQRYVLKLGPRSYCSAVGREQKKALHFAIHTGAQILLLP